MSEGIREIIDALAEALRSTCDLYDPNQRGAAYCAAKVDLKSLSLKDIREADVIAMEIELARRISRS
jgi:hypothetical protein